MFDLSDKTVFITGGAGLLGNVYADAILEYGGTVVIADCILGAAKKTTEILNKKHNTNKCHAVYVDVTNKDSIEDAINFFPNVNVLINNAAYNPSVGANKKLNGHFETMTLEQWRSEITIALDGTFLCSQVFCNKFAKDGGGTIINISSDLGVIAPDQRIYSDDKKPITYSASKFGIIGMTKYLATYFASQNIRVNCLSPGGVYTDQPKDFVDRLSNLIPMGRMAQKNEYKGAIVFLCSDASSYMNGSNLIIDGGRTVW